MDVERILTRLSSYRKCSKRRTLDHSARAISRLRIEDTMKCSHIARGFGCGSISGFAAGVPSNATGRGGELIIHEWT
jgi:hypothetical protein